MFITKFAYSKLQLFCVMIATRKGNKWRQSRIDNSAAFATYSSGRKSARTFSIVAADEWARVAAVVAVAAIFKMMIDS